MNPLANPQIKQRLLQWATSQGFSAEELKKLSSDQRLVSMALRAMAWDMMHPGK